MLEPGLSLSVRDPEGRESGPWVLQGLLARGGQGIVYTMRGPSGQLGVLKVPSPAGLVSMEIERRILQGLPPHRNIVRLLGTADIKGVECPLFDFAYPNPFVRLSSREVREELSRRSWGGDAPPALPACTAIEMVQEVCAGLEHLHGHGYVHGDIKPGNVLVEIDSNRPHLSNRDYFAAIQRRAYTTVLVDFGSTRGAAYLATKTDREEQVVPSEFTPIYAPPELFDPEGRAGPGIDVYQVGLLLYQLVTGHTPYDNYLPRSQLGGLTRELLELKRDEAGGGARGYDPQLVRHTQHEDVFFSEAYQSQARRERFYEDVLRVIETACAPRPQDRPSIGQLRSEITRLFELEPLRAAGPGKVHLSAGNPRWRLRRTNRLAAAARAGDPGDLALEPGTVTHDATTRSHTGTPPAREPTASSPHPGAAGGGGQASAGGVARSARRQAEPAPAAAPQPAGAQAGAQPLSGLRVALVDDDKLALAMVSSILRRRGAKVATFRDPEVALENVAHDHPDALVCDLQMPGLSGLGLLRALGERLSGLPFPAIVFSSVEKEAALQDAFRAGASDYLVKPVAEAELVAKLEKAVSACRASDPEVPAELGGFELLEELRRGETALVFRAAEPWHEGEPAHTVKVLRPTLVGRAAPLLKLARELDVLERCDHPAIPRLIRSGLVGGLLFYVTGTLPERTLGQEVREERTLEVDEVSLLLLEAGGALEHLHAQGLLLGDLTPESMGRLASGRLLLTELGSARWIAGGSLREDEPPLLRSRYAGPELFEATPRVGRPLDLYALGACALEAWSGRPAIRSRASGRIEVAELGQGLPASLLRLIDGMVDPLPGARPSAAQLLAELARLA